MEEKTWLDYLTAIGSVATPVLVLALTAAGWRIRSHLERRIELENRLRDDRIAVYNDILEPLILIFMPEAAWKRDPENLNRDKNEIAKQTILSLAYRQKAFRMSLVGSDEVVRAFNNFMQFFYQLGDGPATDSDERKMLGLIGTFLLAIRRSHGNEHTKLDNWEMLEWFIGAARRHSQAK